MSVCAHKDDPCPTRAADKSRCPGCQGDGTRLTLAELDEQYREPAAKEFAEHHNGGAEADL